MRIKILFSIFLFLSCTQAFGERSIPKSVINPTVEKVYDIAVIGSGAGGTMGALRGVLNNDTVLWSIGGRPTFKQARGYWVPKINSIPMFDGIDRPIISMRDSVIQQIGDSQFKENLHVLNDFITKVKKEPSGLFILSSKKGKFRARNIILATGAMDVQPNINGSIRDILKPANKQQVIYCIRCDGHLALGAASVVVIGGNANSAEIATILVERYAPGKVTILSHGEKISFNAEQQKILSKYNVDVWTAKIEKVIKQKRKLIGFSLEGNKQISADLVVVNLGMRVNNKLAKDLGAKLDTDGYIIGDESGLTSVPGLYVVGDVKSKTRKQVYTAWDQAVRAAEAINATLRLERRKKEVHPVPKVNELRGGKKRALVSRFSIETRGSSNQN